LNPLVSILAIIFSVERFEKPNFHEHIYKISGFFLYKRKLVYEKGLMLMGIKKGIAN
jgi:hypothetical protein